MYALDSTSWWMQICSMICKAAKWIFNEQVFVTILCYCQNQKKMEHFLEWKYFFHYFIWKFQKYPNYVFPSFCAVSCRTVYFNGKRNFPICPNYIIIFMFFVNFLPENYFKNKWEYYNWIKTKWFNYVWKFIHFAFLIQFFMRLNYRFLTELI